MKGYIGLRFRVQALGFRVQVLAYRKRKAIKSTGHEDIDKEKKENLLKYCLIWQLGESMFKWHKEADILMDIVCFTN